MTFKNILITIGLALLFCCSKSNKDSVGNQAFITGNATESSILELAARIHPSPQQLTWQKYETTAFIHFGLNTFTGQEWGDGTTSPKLFNPSNLDVDQWINILKDADMKMVIITAKHHDGFCLWPSAYTDYSVANSPWKDGKGDLIQELSEACKQNNIRLGIYLSPWDRHEPTYGSEKYNDYYVNQLQELLSDYGPIMEVWMDGANGEGPNGKVQKYDWERYYRTIRELQPDAVIAVMGPDVRWVGTESGYGRETEWSVIPANLQELDSISANSQKNEFTKPQINPMDFDLGSREKLLNAEKLVWYPSEVDVSIRPGWFYHSNQDALVKSPAKLLDIYFSSVGRNSVLLLNIPPDQRGLIHEEDQKSLQKYAEALQIIFKTNLTSSATLKFSSSKKQPKSEDLTDDDLHTMWTPEMNDRTPSITAKWEEPKTINTILLQENITQGQRIEKFIVEYLKEENWIKLTEATTIGYKRILRTQTVNTTGIRVIFNQSRLTPQIATLGFYQRLPEVIFEPKGMAFADKVEVKLTSNDSTADIHVTIDGTEPDASSPLYTGPIEIMSTTEIKAFAKNKNGISGFPTMQLFNRAKFKVLLNVAPDIKYTSGGSQILTDGVEGGIIFNNNRWLGFEGQDVEAIVDLGKAVQINSIRVGFLQAAESWIYRPKEVNIYLGSDLNNLKRKFRDRPRTELEKVYRYESVAELSMTNIRFIKIVAKNYGLGPSASPAAGKPTWLFIDEIKINEP